VKSIFVAKNPEDFSLWFEVFLSFQRKNTRQMGKKRFKKIDTLNERRVQRNSGFLAVKIDGPVSV